LEKIYTIGFPTGEDTYKLNYSWVETDFYLLVISKLYNYTYSVKIGASILNYDDDDDCRRETVAVTLSCMIIFQYQCSDTIKP